MLLVGYCFGIRSERRLCEEVHLNLAYRWFCRLGLDGAGPGPFDLLQEPARPLPRQRPAPPRLRGDGAPLHRGGAGRRRGLRGRRQPDRGGREQAALDRPQGLGPGRRIDPDAAPRAVREYLAVLDDAAFGAASQVEPKFISPADPAAQWTGAHEGARLLRLCDQLPDRHRQRHHRRRRGDARHPPGRGRRRAHHDRPHDGPLRPLSRAAGRRQRLRLRAEMLGWLVQERGIEPHIPVFDKSGRSDGTFERADFAYDHRARRLRLPGGKTLRQFHRPADSRTPRSGVDAEGMMRYRASKRDCDACPLKPRCCPGQPQRKILRSIHEGARDMARDIATTDEYVASRRAPKEGRDAVRPPQAHPAPRPAATTRPERRPRRVPPRRRRPEPPEARQARSYPSVNAGRKSARSASAQSKKHLSADFFNGIGQKQTLDPKRFLTDLMVIEKAAGNQQFDNRRTQQDSNLRPLPSEGNALSS